MNRRTRAAVIGVGGWGPQHARALSERDDVELCAVVDQNREAAASCGSQFRVPHYLDLKEMLAQEQPDFVSLAVTNTTQFQPTLEVIRAGVPLLVEKPIAFTLEEADILINEAAQRNLFFAINFNYRYARAMRLAHEAIRQGKIGDPIFAVWRFLGSKSPTNHPHANLIETQCHGFDMLEHCYGPIESVMGEMTGNTGDGFTTMVVSLKFVNGAVGSLIGSYDSSYQFSNTQSLEANGSRGRVLVEDAVRRFTYQDRAFETREIWEAGYFNDVDRSLRKALDAHLDEILPALQEGRDPPVHARAGRRALLLAETTIRSFESGKRIHVLAM